MTRTVGIKHSTLRWQTSVWPITWPAGLSLLNAVFLDMVKNYQQQDVFAYSPLPPVNVIYHYTHQLCIALICLKTFTRRVYEDRIEGDRSSPCTSREELLTYIERFCDFTSVLVHERQGPCCSLCFRYAGPRVQRAAGKSSRPHVMSKAASLYRMHANTLVQRGLSISAQLLVVKRTESYKKNI